MTGVLWALGWLAQAPAAVVVLPPEGPATASELTWVGEIVADRLPRSLTRLGVPAVEREERLHAQESLVIPRATLTRATSIRVAEAVGAGRLVLGNYTLESEVLTLSLRLLDVERATLSGPLMASGPLESLAELIDRLAWDIALAGPVRPSLSREEFLAGRPAVPFEALRAYGLGLAAPDAASRLRQIRRAVALLVSFDEARVALGRLQLEARDYAAAQDTLSKVRADSALSRSARFHQGVALLELGRYREASSLYAGLAAQDPTPAVLNNQAIAALRSGAPGARASPLLRKAVELDPRSADYPFNLGWALLAEGDAEPAAFWLKGVVEKDLRDTRARVVLSWALRKAGRAAEADEEWRRVAALAPSYEPLSSLDLSRRFERVAAAERPLLLDREEKSDADLAGSLLALADKLSAAGDLDGALRQLTRAAYLDPYGAPVHRRLAHLHLARADREKALNELRVSLWCREDDAVRVELAALLLDLGRADEARSEAERVLKTDPANAAARKLRDAR